MARLGSPVVPELRLPSEIQVTLNPSIDQTLREAGGNLEGQTGG